jgi:hypothetical protein
MIKLIVNDIDGIQRVIEVEESGKYFDETFVVWDERKDGKLTDEQLALVGGLTKQDGKLVVSEQLKKQSEDLIKAKVDAENKVKSDRQARVLVIQGLDKANTVVELKAVLKAIIDELKLGKG